MDGLKTLYRVLNRGSIAINKVMRVVVGVLVFAIFLTVLLQVANRYVLSRQTLFHWRSVSWTEELARYLLIAISYFALGLCYKYGHMARADMVYSRLGRTGKRALYLFECALIAVFLGSVFYYGTKFAAANRIFRSDLLQIPGNVLYSIPLVGYAGVAYEMITEIAGVLSGEIEPFTSASAAELKGALSGSGMV